MNEFIKIKNSIIKKNEIVFIRFLEDFKEIKIIIKNDYEIKEKAESLQEFEKMKEMLIKTLIEIK